MTRKSSKKTPLSKLPGIDWHDDEVPSHLKKKPGPTPSQRLATMSNLVAHLAHSDEPATHEDIRALQILARGEDIDIDSLEI